MRAVPLVLMLLFVGLLGFFGEERRCCQAQKLVEDEVNALKIIGMKLKKKWDFSVEPCSKSAEWVKQQPPPNYDKFVADNVTCSCDNATTSICHVSSILLMSQNLTGELPPEIANLTQLKYLDLSRNYLNGTIPTAWASLPLINLTLLGNRVYGRIPDELGNISTLVYLNLEDNLLEGPIPATLGKLANLSRMLLSANFFSGELPDSLGNLKNLTDLRLDGNPISGKIPNFIGNWTKLKQLHLQGTSLEGPIPTIISNLSYIYVLRISDLKKGIGEFPPLQNMSGMQELVLRNLSISGAIPYYIGNMPLHILDLSFNNLSGAIPKSFNTLQMAITFMFLTNNMLQGATPRWNPTSNVDLSYNSFTSQEPDTCQDGNTNLVSSYSSTSDNSISSCLRRNLPCAGKRKNYQLFINCGGPKTTIGDDEYEDDSSQQGASIYAQRGNWAYSSTGALYGKTYKDKSSYIVSSASTLNISNPELYKEARISPLLIRYYGLCLQKGNYTVNLHFAEIVFTDDQTFFSVGRRIFDVSIQGQKVLQDFNIAKEANGTGKGTIKSFTTLVDDTGTLEIHLHWSGKGTNAIPERGVFGPLISAISITPNFKPDKGGLSVGAILGIIGASCGVIWFVSILLLVYLRRKNIKENELRGLDLQTSIFSLRQIKAATNNFDGVNKIGEGGFGPVYKGILPGGLVIAVKQLSSKSRQGNREFVNEIGMISALQHPNLVKLYGCCIEGNQLLLIYEYMENNSLARALFGPEQSRLNLDWQTRRRICIGIARGLTYLHEESRLKIVHRDIKATNILLDKDLNAKISDFGLAKLDEEENTHISTRIAGTIGYMAPEYATRGYLTDKADVYSFGVVVLEIVSGKSNTNYRPKEDRTYLLDWAYVLAEQGRLLELVDENLGSNYSKEEAQQMLNLVLICTNQSQNLRPSMSMVVSMLDGQTPVEVPSVKREASKRVEITRFESFETITSYDSQNHSISTDGPPTGPSTGESSTSGHRRN